MRNRTIVCVLAAASLSLGSLSSFAQGYDRDRGDHRHDQRWQRDHDHRADYRGANRPDHYYYGARGPEWRRGGHIPPQYRSRQYVVSDWRAHRLSAPPRGYQWVQVGGDYVMVAIATGIIAQLLLNQ